MILKTLTLHNYRKYKHTVIDFPDGITAVVGLNGSGKSTLFEAIAWVLYGAEAARTPTDQIKREGADPKDPCRVELEFIFEEHNYKVTREMTGKNLTPSAAILVDGALAATGAEAVTMFIEKRLSMDYRSFFTSILAKQKELNVLSTITPGERRLLILRMLGIDILDDVIRAIKGDAKNKTVLIDRLQIELIDEKGADRIELTRREIEALKLKQREIEEEIQRRRNESTIIKEQIKDIEKQCKEEKEVYEAAQQTYRKLSEKKNIYERKMKLEEYLSGIKKRIEKRREDIKIHEEKLKNLEFIEQDKKDTERRLQETNERKESYIKMIESKRTIIEGLNREIKDIENRRKNITKIGEKAECPTCERVLGNQYYILIDKFNKEIDDRSNSIKRLEEEVKKLEHEYDKITREYKALQKKKDYVETRIQEKRQIQTVLRHLGEEIDREEKEKERIEKELNDIGLVVFNLSEYEEIKKQVDISYSRYQRILDKLDDIKESYNKYKIEIEKIEGDKRVILQELKNLELKNKELEDKKLQVSRERVALQHLNMLSTIMSQFRDHLVSRIQPTLSLYASDYLERLTDGRYHEIIVDDSYDIQIIDDGNPYSIERFSGGEEDIANLCLRLAISEVITERAGGAFNFIILDEIFGSQDNIRRQNILKALNGLTSKFRQIFLVTHIDDIKNYTDNTLIVSEDEEGVSSVRIE